MLNILRHADAILIYRRSQHFTNSDYICFTILIDTHKRYIYRDDQIIFNGILMYVGVYYIEKAKYLPWWNTDGAILIALLHMGPVEFLYYWFHRALHHHFLYSRYHSHHHASIVTEPITCE